MTQLAALSRLNALHTADATPSAVTTARVVSIVQAGLLLVAGVVLLLNGLGVLGIASLGEGVVRFGLAVGLRRGARRTRLALVVLSAIGVFVGFAVGGLSIIGGIVNIVIVRCLRNDEAMQFLGA